MELLGLHHTTHVTDNASATDAFYTRVLGMRRTWKTVNFDDPSVYHLAYGDRAMSPGTNLTFFEHPGIRPDAPGVGSVASVALDLAQDDDLRWWADRLAEEYVAVTIDESGDRSRIAFRDPGGLRLELIAGGASGPRHVAWPDSTVPAGHRIRGLHSVTLVVREPQPTRAILLGLLGLREVARDGDAFLYALGDGGPGRELRVVVAPHAPNHKLGAGGTHHIAFWAASLEDVDRYAELVRRRGLPTSGVIDRTYFHNLYFREPGGVLLEIATDVPGRSPYADDAEVGEKLVLPDHLEDRRTSIEAALRPLDPRAYPTSPVGGSPTLSQASPMGAAKSSA